MHFAACVDPLPSITPSPDRFAIPRNFKSSKYTVKNPDSRGIMVLQDREFAEIVKGDNNDWYKRSR